MELNYKEFGTGDIPLVIMHGLYGSSDNWVSIAKQLQDQHHVFLIDLRNHGQSPHDPDISIELMANDLEVFLNKKGLSKINLAGHSMGGKVAMRFALKHPDYIHKLVVLDISPKSYLSFSNFGKKTNNHALILDSLISLDISNGVNRKTLDKELAKNLEDARVRQFLLKNLTRDENKKFHWQINLHALRNNLEKIMDGFTHLEPNENKSDLTTIFIRGEHSGYLAEEDLFTCRKFFPGAEFATIPEAGHWLHAEQPDLLIKTMNYFLTD